MDQLLNITTVPISIEIVVQKAKLEYNNELPKVHVTREKGGLRMQADPIKIDIDNTKVFDSIGLKKSDTLTREFADEGMRIAYQATAKIVQDGNQLMNFQDITPAQLAAQQNQRRIETIMSFLPKDGPDISWSGGTLNITYEADELNFDWSIPFGPVMEFVPADIEFNIKSLPKVNIEYVGDPIYCPPSANPNYEPIFDLTI